MKNKLLTLFGAFILMLFLSLFSCEDDIDCGPFHSKFKTTELGWSISEAVYSETADVKLSINDIQNDSVDFDKYAIVLHPDTESYSANTPSPWHFSLIQSAYACSPPPLSTDEKIDSIFITSTTDFDANHPAGTDLADLFDIVISSYFMDTYQEKFDLVEFLETSPAVPNDMTLILKGQPDVTANFEFNVKYYQDGVDDNDFFEHTTDAVVIRHE